MKKTLAKSSLILVSLMLLGCTPKNITFNFEPFLIDVDIHTEEQNTRFFNNPNVLSDTYLNYLDGLYYRNDYSKPLPVTLNFTAVPDRGKVGPVTITISDDASFNNSFVDVANGSVYEFYNGKIGETYFFKLSAHGFTSDVYSFTIANDNGFRLINIDGVANVRDLGGNGNIKQGVIYRGSAFEKNDDDVINQYISQAGIKQITNLGIKTEIDLRKNVVESGKTHAENCDLTTSKVSGVNYVNLPMYYGGKNILTYKNDTYDNPEQIKQFFLLLADETKLPVYMHCSEGKDRTGCLSYLVEGLLGEEKETRYRDYVFSNFANTSYSMKPSGIDGNFGKTLDEYKTTESTFSEVVYNYLNKVIGLEKETLDKVILNLKENGK